MHPLLRTDPESADKFGHSPYLIVLNYSLSLRFSFIFEMLLASFVLADQVRILKDNKVKANNES